MATPKFLIRLQADENGIRDLAKNNWTVNGTFTFDKDCPFGGKKITIPNAGASLTLGAGILPELDHLEQSDWTMSLWCNMVQSGGGYDTLINGYRYAPYQRLSFCYDWSATPNIILYGNERPPRVHATSVIDDTIHHVAFVHTVSDKKYRIFIDGTLSASYTDTGNIAMFFNIAGTSLFSEAQGDGNAFCKGDFWDVCFIKDLALWVEDFTPPTSYLSLPSTIYLSYNEVYGVKDNTLKKLADDYTQLTDAQKIEIYNSVETDATINALGTLPMPFTLEVANDYNKSLNCTMLAIPDSQLILSNNLIDLGYGHRIKNIDIVAESDVKIAITNDGENYYVYNTVNRLWEMIETSEIGQKGMSSSLVKSLKSRDWHRLISDKIGFAFEMNVDSIDEISELKKIKIQYW